MGLIVITVAVAVMIAWDVARRVRRRRVGPDGYHGVDDFRRTMDAIAPEPTRRHPGDN